MKLATPLLALTLSTLTLACAPPPVGPPDPELDAGPAPELDPSGLYTLDELTIDEDGAPILFTPNTSPGIAATVLLELDEASATLTLYNLDLRDGLPDEEVRDESVIFDVVDDETWSFTEEGETSTFAVSVDEEEVHLERTDGSEGPLELRIARALPLDVIGAWRGSSLVMGGEAQDLAVCTPRDARFEQSEVRFTVDDRHGAELRVTGGLYTDAACTTEDDVSDNLFAGIALERTGGVQLLLHEVDAEADPVQMNADYTTTITGDELRWSLEGCVPEPDCRDELPTEVVFTAD